MTRKGSSYLGRVKAFWISAFAGKSEEKQGRLHPIILILSLSKDEDGFHDRCGGPCFDRLSMRRVKNYDPLVPRPGSG